MKQVGECFGALFQGMFFMIVPSGEVLPGQMLGTVNGGVNESHDLVEDGELSSSLML